MSRVGKNTSSNLNQHVDRRATSGWQLMLKVEGTKVKKGKWCSMGYEVIDTKGRKFFSGSRSFRGTDKRIARLWLLEKLSQRLRMLGSSKSFY